MIERVRILTNQDLDAFTRHSELEFQQSGTGGDPVSTPYSKEQVFDFEERKTCVRKYWETSLQDLGWRRAWGVFEGEILIAEIELCGAALASESHRVSLGMSVLRGYRRQGFGQAMLETVIDWSRNRKEIAWIDLGVFKGNDPAFALYTKMGFTECGRTPDKFRVDGQKIEDIQMRLSVSCL
jgi:ribosomal protein S18 acetylase RimI-like enzyme